MDNQKRVPLQLMPQHLDFIINLLGTGALRYVDTAPIIQDITQQVQANNAQAQAPLTGEKTNGAAHAQPDHQ